MMLRISLLPGPGRLLPVEFVRLLAHRQVAIAPDIESQLIYTEGQNNN